jgi:hypothetical protein
MGYYELLETTSRIYWKEPTAIKTIVHVCIGMHCLPHGEKTLDVAVVKPENGVESSNFDVVLYYIY